MEYGSVTLNKEEKEIISLPLEKIKRKYRHKGHKDDHGLEFDATKLFMDYYRRQIEQKREEIRKIEKKLERWEYQYECEIWPDL